MKRTWRDLHRAVQQAEASTARMADELIDAARRRAAEYTSGPYGTRGQACDEVPGDQITEALRRLLARGDWREIRDRATNDSAAIAAKARDVLERVDWEKLKPAARTLAVTVAIGIATGGIILTGDEVEAVSALLTGDAASDAVASLPSTPMAGSDGDVASVLSRTFLESSVLRDVSQLAFDSHIGVLRSPCSGP